MADQPVHSRGEVCHYHRANVTPGVRRGVVLSSGAHGCTVKDVDDDTNHDVLHEGIYSHATAHAADLPAVVLALTAMGLPLHVTDRQRSALRDKE